MEPTQEAHTAAGHTISIDANTGTVTCVTCGIPVAAKIS